MYTLYWERLSGAIVIEAMLEEMAVPYQTVAIDMAAGEHLQPRYLAINPTGQVPAIRFPDGGVMGESAAIVLAIGDRHPNSSLVPLARDVDRPQFLYWLLYMATTGYTTAGRVGHPERYTTDAEAVGSIYAAAEAHYDRLFDVLNDAIQGSPYFLARGYSVLDACLTMLSLWHPDSKRLYAENPKVSALCRAVMSRESFARVLSKHVPAASVQVG